MLFFLASFFHIFSICFSRWENFPKHAVAGAAHAVVAAADMC